MKSVVLILCGLLLVGFSLPASAASFDCAKVTLPAEKFVCANPFISGLDDKLDAVYRSVLAKASDEQKQQVMAQQKHWLKHTRNVCTREVCFKHAYWTRQAELATFFEPKSPLYAKESDKAAAIQKVLAEAPLYESTQSDSMCHEVFTALKEMRGIRFVDPVVQTMSYEDPALDPWKQRARRTLFAKRCVPNVPLSFDYMCEARFSGDDADNDLLECEAWYGLPPFKIFELPSLKPQEKTRYIFYEDSGYGPMNREGVPWYPVTSGGNFGEFFTENCNNSDSKKGVYVFRMPRSSDKDDGFPNFNSVIIYRERYFILALERVTSSFWLTLRPIDVNATCRWSPVKPGPPVNK